MKKKTLFIFYLILALYLINMSFTFINLNFLSFLNKWVLLASAILLLVEGFRYLRYH